jgi:hypothetical protein
MTPDHDDLGDLGDFAPPPFDPAAGLATLRRSLRDLQLVERDGQFEWKGLVVASATIEGREIAVQVARKPLRSPDWEKRALRNHADLRRWTDELRKRLVHWADARHDDA